MMMSYAEAVRRPPPSNHLELKHFNTNQTNVVIKICPNLINLIFLKALFRQIKGYDGNPLTVVRQFSCRQCLKAWWTRVRVFKQVSKCKKCYVKYDPIPADLEFGKFQF